MDINEATAKAIQAERAIAGLTVRELSARSGIPMSTLMRMLGAQREIKVTQVEQVADAMDVYPHEIIEQAEVIMGRAARAVERPIAHLAVVSDPATTLHATDQQDEDEIDERAVAAGFTLDDAPDEGD